MNSMTGKKIRLIMELRNLGITDDAVLNAIETTPREEFILPQMLDQAYENTALPIGQGQTISQPLIVAAMTQALELTDRDKVLEIGTGSGYQTCILSPLCRRVYTIERHKPLLQQAEEMFARLNIRNVTAIAEDGMKGWPKRFGEQAPFDKIIITAAAREKPPQALLDQLKIGGIMVVPVDLGGEQILRRYKKEDDDMFSLKDLMPVRFVPLLPDIATYDESRKEYG